MKLKKSRLEQIIKEELQLFSKTNGTFIIKESESIAGVLPTAEEKKLLELKDLTLDKNLKTIMRKHNNNSEIVLQLLLSTMEDENKVLLNSVLNKLVK